jgi:GTP cyclohydrolase I
MIDEKKIVEGVRLILEGLGVNLEDENFKYTPQRFLDFLKELAEPKILNEDYVTFTSVGNLVIVKDIRAYSLCPHHLLPVIYDVNIAYIPKGKVVGLSKIARLTLNLCGKLMLQEDYTEVLANELIKLVGSEDVMVVVKGVHFCMIMRGVKQQKSEVITSSIRGVFWTNLNPREEVLKLMEI